MQETFKLTLLAIILSFLLLILITLLAATFRRIIHARKYKKLDRHRNQFRENLKSSLASGDVLKKSEEYRSSPNSIEFQAKEDVLLEFVKEEKYKKDIKELFVRLGYVDFYEKRLKSSDNIKRATAIDKLGKMFSESSTDKLINVLETKNVEIITVAVRSLAKIGSVKALKGILEHLPKLFKELLISQKAVEIALANFGTAAVPVLIDYGNRYRDIQITASFLEVLSNLPVKKASCAFALENLQSKNPEVRAKALKVISQSDIDSIDFDGDIILPLLKDPVWFVRLQAAKALGNIKYQIDKLGELLLDENWQVRNATAMALTKFEDDSIGVFLSALRNKDPYVKASICEEIEKTFFIYRLIENLGSTDKKIFEQSKEILQIMHEMNFSTPLQEFLGSAQSDKIKNEIGSILHKAVKR